MHVQLLSFRFSDPDRAMSPTAASRFELALQEFPGLIATRFVPGTYAFANNVWEDRAALDRFRRSEVYAHLMLDPFVEWAEDRLFGAGRFLADASLAAA